jgi:hypothetical protein
VKTETNYWVVLGSHDAAAIGSTSWEKKHGKAVWYVFRSVPGAGGVYVASGAVRSHRNPQVSHPPFGLPARSWMPPGLREKRTQVPNSRTPPPMMDAAFCVSIKTRHDRTELQSPDQHAANRDASWFFCSVIGLSNSRVKMGGLNSFSQHASTKITRPSTTPRGVTQLFI